LQPFRFFAKALFSKMALVVCCLMLITGSAHAQALAGLADAGSTNPVAGPLDITQFSTNGNGTFPDGLVYYTSDPVADGIGEPGQTFKTGADAESYTVTSLAIKSGGLSQFNGSGTPKTYVLHLYKVTGSN